MIVPQCWQFRQEKRLNLLRLRLVVSEVKAIVEHCSIVEKNRLGKIVVGGDEFGEFLRQRQLLALDVFVCGSAAHGIIIVIAFQFATYP